MNKAMTQMFRVLLPLALLAAGCSKMDEGFVADNESHKDYNYNSTVLKEDLLAVATLRTQDGIRFLQLDPGSVGYIVNQDDVADIRDKTRVFVQYKSVLSDRPDFCTESVWVDWATPLDVGSTSLLDFEESYSNESFLATAPVDIVLDWITSLEDGFLTLHYTIPASGENKHSFTLYRSWAKGYHFFLVHDAHGDTEGSLTDGIVCFPVENLLPDTGGETVTLSLTYLNLKNTSTTLTVDYRTQK